MRGDGTPADLSARVTPPTTGAPAVDLFAPPDSVASAALGWFEFLDREGVHHVVLGRERPLSAFQESDIDVAVDPELWEALPGLLLRFCRGRGLRLVQAIRHERTAWFFVCSWRAGGRLHHLRLDLCSDYVRGGKLLVPARRLLADRRRAPSPGGGPAYWTPAPAIAFEYYLVKSIAKGRTTTEGLAALRDWWGRDPPGCAAALRRHWKPQVAEEIERTLRDDGDAIPAERLPRIAPAARSLSVRGLAADLVRVVERLRRPTGLHVVLLGPDGAGKSSVLECVADELGPCFWRARQYHLRPHFGRDAGEGTAVTDPHGKAARGVIASTAKLGWWLADYMIGYWSSVRPALSRTTLVTFDRYYHDLLADPVRYRYRGTPAAVRLVGRLIPGPDLTFVLDVPAEVARARKQEVTAREAERQRVAYRALAEELGAQVVDASQPLQVVARVVADRILDSLAARITRRFRDAATAQP